MSKFLYTLMMCALACAVSAQTPEQQRLIELRQAQEAEGTTADDVMAPGTEVSSASGFYVAESDTPLIDEIELTGLTPDQQQQTVMKAVKGKIIVTTGDYTIIETPSGMRLCTFEIGMMNFTDYAVEQIQIFYDWSGTETFASFSGVSPLQATSTKISLAGSVCTRIRTKPRLRAPICRLTGATEAFCREAIVFGSP